MMWCRDWPLFLKYVYFYCNKAQNTQYAIYQDDVINYSFVLYLKLY